MNRQPDKIFREKLQGYQRPAPSGAWARISQNLHRKSNSFPWLKIAAAATLLAMATYLLFPFKTAVQQTKIAQETRPAAKNKPESQRVQKNKEQLLAEDSKKKDEATNAGPQRKSSRKNPRPRMPAVDQVPVTIDTPQEAISDVVPADKPFIADAQPTRVEPKHPGVDLDVSRERKSTHRMTIIFSAQEVNEKYLEKKEVAEATPNGKESSSLRKLLDKAYDLKHNQDPLGELRQKKNEILAFNFKNERQQHD